jgi:hypothetical protein
MKIQSSPDLGNSISIEFANAQRAFSSFFEYNDLSEAKEQLWLWLEATVTGKFPKDLSRRERSNILEFYRRLENLLEDLHRLHSGFQKQQTNESTFDSV